jgi:hypothetical protein
MPDFGIFRGFNEKLFGDKLYAGQLPINLGLIGSQAVFDIDPDALAFFDRVTAASGTLSATEKLAIDTLVKQMKSDGIWTKMKAIYPMVGASAAACAQNLKSASFTGVFNGGWTFASTGVTPNGTNGFFNTFFIPSVEFSGANASISVYTRTSGSKAADFGRFAIGAIICYNNLSGSVYSWFGDSGFAINADTNNGLGLFNYQRTSSSNKNVFVNSTKVLNANTTFTSWPNLSIPFGAYLNGPSFAESSGRQIAFAHLGDALTDTEAPLFYNSVQSFQTTLSRQV